MTRRANNQTLESTDMAERERGEWITAKSSKTCCKNDGICILNSFCYCKQQYYGRYCEHRLQYKSCGTIAHGTWMTAACNICHCYDGRMICEQADFPNCGNTFQDGFEKELDYNGGIENVYEEYVKFYDEYDTGKIAGGSSRNTLTHWVLATVFVSFGYTGITSWNTVGALASYGYKCQHSSFYSA